MILKKPYAFLIKHFRLIHLILTVLIGYIFFRAYKIYSFFSRYVSNVYSTLSDANPSNYITLYMILIIIIIITFALAMYLLMRKKEKPRVYYIILSVYYLVFLILLIVCFNIFNSFETLSLSIRNAMILRDVTIIISLPQVVFMVLSLIRGIGFDIKKFNFSKDLKELDLNEEDNEEFEFVVGGDSYKYFRWIRRRLREFKYYILENKFMFTILCGLTGVILIILVILNFTVYNRTYNKNQTFSANNLTISVNNSYLTNMDYKGDIISSDKYFLVVNMTFTNESGYSTVLELSNYRLYVSDDDIVYPTLTRNTYFIDLGTGYAKETIAKDTTSTYILVYELSSSQVKSKYTLSILDEVEFNAGTINSKEKNVSLTPIVYTEIDDPEEYELGKTVKLYDSVLGDSTLNISSYEFKSKFTYTYEACVRVDCSTKTDVVSADVTKSKTLLLLTGTLNLSSASSFMTNSSSSSSFFDYFVQIKYDNTTATVTDATPSSVTEKYILQVPQEASKAKSISLIITIRNKQYIIKLK